MDSRSSDADVVIVGGGPVGLFLASELAPFGIRVIVLERRPTTVDQPRALGFHCRTVEVFALRGIHQRFVDRAFGTLPVAFFASLETHLDLTVLDTVYPFGVLIPQTVTEEVLAERALEVGVDYRRGWKVEEVRETADRVHVSGRHEGGPFECTADWVVGADGARSLVRERVGIDFPGMEATKSFYFGHVKVSGLAEHGTFSRENEEGSVLCAHMGEGRYRLVFIDPSRFHVPVREPVSLEEMQDGVRRIVGPGVTLSEPGWLSRFGNETRLAETYRKGRVFLAGDAAHIHLPAGGQGMGTGLQDALNLGWKLAGVIRGRAPEALLDSYERERRPVAAGVCENTLAQGAVITVLGREGDALRGMVNGFLRVPEVNRRTAEMITAMGVAYPEPILAGHDVGPAEFAGRRLTNFELRRADGTTIRLYELLRDGNWLDLEIVPGGEPCPLPPGIAREWVKRESAGPTDERSFLAQLRSVLIRPDGHVAFARTSGA